MKKRWHLKHERKMPIEDEEMTRFWQTVPYMSSGYQKGSVAEDKQSSAANN